jgi:signal transduction histidine kinase
MVVPVTTSSSLTALNRAVLALSRDAELDEVLRTILKTAQELAHARYAALGIPDGHGGFGTFLTAGISEARARRIGTLPRAHGVLGLLLHKGPIRVRDIRRHPQFSYYPDDHPVMRDFLGVPIRHRGKVLGNLFLAERRRDHFTTGDQRLVEMLAAHAGIAISTARLHAEARQLAVLQERNRLARELHDSISQTLFSVTYEAKAASIRALADGSDVTAALSRLQGLAEHAMDELRDLVFALRPRSLERDGLVVTLTDHVGGVQRIHGAPIRLRIDGGDQLRLRLDEEEALFRIAQEALHNAIKYAPASAIEVSLADAPAGVRLTVVDHGPGFDQSALPRTRRTLGLTAMQERARAIRAALEVTSQPGQGCRVSVLVKRHG